MTTKKHTKKQLIELSPEAMLYQHIDNLKLPEFIKIELYEQMTFFSNAKKILMNSWTRWDFENWYYSD